MIARGAFAFLLYSYLIFFGTPLPLIALQAVAILALVISVAIQGVKLKTPILPMALWIYLLILLSYVVFSMTIGLGNAETPPSLMFRFAQNFLLTFTLPLLGFSLVVLGISTSEQILRQFVLASVTFAAIKCLLVGIVYFSGVPIEDLTYLSIKFFQTRPTLDLIAPHVIRFQPPSDFVLPFALFQILYGKPFRLPFLVLSFLLCATALFFSFSRFIWLEALFAIFLWWLSLPRHVIAACLVAALVLIPVAMNSVDLPLIEHRFSSSATSASDMTRLGQYESLAEDMGDHFLIGHGFASFTLDYIRDVNSPYSYELQWIALLYQMGSIGVALLIGLLFFVAAPLFEHFSLEGAAMLLLFGFFALSGFANPALIGRSASVIYLAVLMFGIRQSGTLNTGPDTNWRSPPS